MAIAYQSAGTLTVSGQNPTTIAPPHPASIAAGDGLVLIVGFKPGTENTGSVDTPSGWTALAAGFGGGYGTTLGIDTGNTYVAAFWKQAVGGETGNLTVTLNGSPNMAWAQILRMTKGASAAWN